MPDITMCTNDSCERRKGCYRYTAKPSEHRQSYSGFSADENGECEHYWPTEEEENEE